MREIKFRGKRFTNDSWVYGVYVPAHCSEDDSFIYTLEDDKLVPVKEGTVGQYVGIKDKNGVEIYEQDIIRKVPEEWPSKDDTDPRTLEEYLHDLSRISIVEYQRDRFCLVRDGQYTDRISGGQHGSIEVIDN